MVEYDNIADFEKGREYSREICDKVQTVNNAIQALRSQDCTELKKVSTVPPGTTPDEDDVKDLKEELDSVADHMYEEHGDRDRITRHIIDAQQSCINCLIEVYEDDNE